MPVSSACRLLQIDVFEPVDLIHGHDLLDDEVFHDTLMLAESGMIGAALAAPYCSKHSRATLRRPGPRPVRTPSHLDGVPDNTVDQQLSVQESSIIHDRARLLLSAVDRQNGLAILENPSSSMTWLDEWMSNWVHTVAPLQPMPAHANLARIWLKHGASSPISLRLKVSLVAVITLLERMNLWLVSACQMALSNRDSLRNILNLLQPHWHASSLSSPRILVRSSRSALGARPSLKKSSGQILCTGLKMGAAFQVQLYQCFHVASN